MKDMFKRWLSLWIKVLGVVFGVLGAVSIVLPLDNVTSDNITMRLIVLALIVLATMLVGAGMLYYHLRATTKRLHASEKSSVYFEYQDLKKVLEKVSADTSETSVTFVVPINTNLTLAFDKEIINKGTIHSLALDYLEQCKALLGIDDLKTVRIKRIAMKTQGEPKEKGRIGDWFLVTSGDIANLNPKVKFLFAELYNVEQKNGKWMNVTPTKEEYLLGIQSLIHAISEALDQEEKVYIPLIGAGAGNVGKSTDVTRFLAEMLRFNKSSLKQEIHIVINEKFRQETPIYDLPEF